MGIRGEKVNQIDALKKNACIIRYGILDMVIRSQYGFLGSCYSCVDLVTALGGLNDVRCFEQKNSCLIISKGHVAPVYYICHEFFTGENLDSVENYARLGSLLQAHPNSRIFGQIVVPSGSLGLAVPAALGYAIGLYYKHDSRKVYILVGDGELQEGIVFEAILALCRIHIEVNVSLIVDVNGKQSGGNVEKNDLMKDLLNKLPIDFYEIEGNSMTSVVECLSKVQRKQGMSIIWANTTRGAGIPDFNVDSRMSYIPSEQQAQLWRNFLSKQINLKKNE